MNADLFCGGCGGKMTEGDHSGCLSARTKLQDTRKTSAEKLERLRIIADDMLRVAAREPDNEALRQLSTFSTKIHAVLDGEFV